MTEAARSATRASEASPSNPLKTMLWIVFGLFIIALGVSIAETLSVLQLPVSEGLVETGLVFIATIATLLTVLRQLPLQNVLLAAVIIGCIGGAVQALGALTGIPFGPLVYTQEAGPRLFNTLPWFVPFIWIIAILASRGVARLILRPWRKLRRYGFWLIGLTTVLALIFDLGLEPFATRLKNFWLWSPTKLPVNWYGTPLSNFLGWMVTTILILAFTMPSLINKKPGRSVPDYYPLILWIGLNFLFISGTAAQHLWLAVGLISAASVCTIVFAIRGARW